MTVPQNYSWGVLLGGDSPLRAVITQAKKLFLGMVILSLRGTLSEKARKMLTPPSCVMSSCPGLTQPSLRENVDRSDGGTPRRRRWQRQTPGQTPGSGVRGHRRLGSNQAETRKATRGSVESLWRPLFPDARGSQVSRVRIVFETTMPCRLSRSACRPWKRSEDPQQPRSLT